VNRLVTLSLVAFGIASALAACDDDPAGPSPGESFTLAVGETATLEAVRTSVRFLVVSEDSRCPSRAQCVWAGDGAVVLEIAPLDGDAAEHMLHTNPESGPSAMVLAGYELTLLGLDPYPETPGDIASDKYRATLALYERLESGSD
jgi:hypothetical protein